MRLFGFFNAQTLIEYLKTEPVILLLQVGRETCSHPLASNDAQMKNSNKLVRTKGKLPASVPRQMTKRQVLDLVDK